MRNQSGIGIIELMVSITIGAFVLAGVVQLYLTSAQNVSAFEGSSRIQENARYVFSRLEKDISRAGNMGCFSFTTVNNRVDNILGVDAAPGELYDFTRFIDGENDDGVGAVATDRLILRMVSSEDRYPVASTADGQINLVSEAEASHFKDGKVAIVGDCSTATVFYATGNSGSAVLHPEGGTGQHNTSDNLIGQFVGSADVNSITEGTSLSYVYGGESGAIDYEIGTSVAADLAGATCGASTPQYCALFRKGTEIVEGLEDIQFEYGWIDAAGSLFFKDSEQVDAESDPDEAWSKIDRVRVTATFNSINNATTNEGVDLLTRTYSRVFVIANQLPLCTDC